MKYLFFFVHPSKVKVFRNTINYLKKNQHDVDIVITSKDVLEELVISEGWDYYNIFPEGRKIKNLPSYISAFINMFKTIYRLNKYINARKYDLFITDDLLSILGFYKKIPSIVFQDDDLKIVPESSIILFFANHILSPSCTKMGIFEKKKIGYYGYKELGGLHPKIFTPNIDFVKEINSDLKPYYIIRLVSLRATHDFGKAGLNDIDVRRLIDILEKKGLVYISSEREISEEFEKYRLNIKAKNLPHILHFSNLLITDSQTMSTEAAVLGTPFIRFNDFVGKISSMNEIENVYELGYGVKPSEKDKLFRLVESLINNESYLLDYKKKWDKMINEKIILSDFLSWFLECYPESVNQMKDCPQYQTRFK